MAETSSLIYERAKDYYVKKDFNRALCELSKIDLKDLGNFSESLVHHYNALCYANLMKLNKSVAEFDLAIKFKPNSAKIHFDKGLTYYFFYTDSKLTKILNKFLNRKSVIEKAMTSFEDGLLLEPENADLWYYRGYMLELCGKTNDACRSFKKSLECDKEVKDYEKSGLFRRIRDKKSFY